MTGIDRQARVRRARQESRARIVAAATELVRQRSYAELSIEAIMREAGFGRTIFYRHFDDLADLLQRAGREAIEELYEAQQTLERASTGDDADAIAQAIELAVATYQRHGPLLRAITEAAAGDLRIAAGLLAMRQRFNDFAEQALRRASHGSSPTLDIDFAETARAVNLMNEAYLLDTFGRTPRIAADVAARTLIEIWLAVIERASDHEARDRGSGG